MASATSCWNEFIVSYTLKRPDLAGFGFGHLYLLINYTGGTRNNKHYQHRIHECIYIDTCTIQLHVHMHMHIHIQSLAEPSRGPSRAEGRAEPTICQHRWPQQTPLNLHKSKGINGNPCGSIEIHGHPCESIEIHGVPRIFMETDRNLWKYIGIHGN